jgi:hypothetical protein
MEDTFFVFMIVGIIIIYISIKKSHLFSRYFKELGERDYEIAKELFKAGTLIIATAAIGILSNYEIENYKAKENNLNSIFLEKSESYSQFSVKLGLLRGAFQDYQNTRELLVHDIRTTAGRTSTDENSLTDETQELLKQAQNEQNQIFEYSNDAMKKYWEIYYWFPEQRNEMSELKNLLSEYLPNSNITKGTGYNEAIDFLNIKSGEDAWRISERLQTQANDGVESQLIHTVVSLQEYDITKQ